MKKNLLKAAAVLTVIAAVGGCTKGGTEPTKETKQAGATTEAKTAETKTNESKGDEKTSAGGEHYRIMTAFRPQHEDFDKMPLVQEILKDANITVTWEQVGDAALKEKKNIAISTGNIPDAMLGMVDTNDVIQNPELFMPLDKYIDSMPNVSKLMKEHPDAKTFLTFPDGHIYSFPFVQEREYEGFPDQLWINKAWLDKLGLAVPKTYKEYEEVLKAFKDKDPNGNGQQDELPLTMRVTHSYFGTFSMYGMFGRLDEPSRLIPENNKLVFTANKEEWKNATKWFAELYKQGLIDPESFTQDTSMLFAKGKAKPEIVGSMNAFIMDNVVGKERMKDYQFVLLEGPSGQKAIRFRSFPVQNRTIAVVSSKLEKPDGMMRFFDTCLDEKKNYPLQTVFGLIGKQLVKTTEPGKEFEFAKPPEGLSQDDYRFKDAPADFPTYLTKASWASIVHSPDVARKEKILEECRPYLQKESMPPVLYTDEESQQLADISSAILDYVSQQQALWITGQGDIDAEWDAYCKKLDDMRVNDYVKINQAAYDRYYSK